MLLTKKIILESPLEISEIFSAIKNITSNVFERNSTKIKFEGEVYKEGFKILPTYTYSEYDRVRPEIQGMFIKSSEARKIEIHLTFVVPRTLLLLFVFAFALNVCIFIYHRLISSSLYYFGYMQLVAILILLIVFVGTYLFRISECIKIFKKLWKIK